MRTILVYKHTRNLFKGNCFKPFVYKYFKDVRFKGTESGNWGAMLEVSNYHEVKDVLPKYAKPISAICG